MNRVNVSGVVLNIENNVMYFAIEGKWRTVVVGDAKALEQLKNDISDGDYVLIDGYIINSSQMEVGIFAERIELLSPKKKNGESLEKFLH